MTVLNPPPVYDPNEDRADRRAHRAKCAAINTPVEYGAREPSRQTNNPKPSTTPATNDALWLAARGAR
jgi:hypothetical protein